MIQKKETIYLPFNKYPGSTNDIKAYVKKICGRKSEKASNEE
jgi:hypothetical protein